MDDVSQIHILEREQIDEMMVVFASKIIRCLGIERMSVWLFNDEKTMLISMGEYDSRDNSFKKGTELLEADFPTYFAKLRENKIIIAENIYTHDATKELDNKYAKPNDIITLMDMPMRVAGELVGVMCCEKTGDVPIQFSGEQQTFALSVSLVFASNLEARYRRKAQFELTKLLEEKNLLINEMNHRIKNNFTILISLLRLSKGQSKSETAVLLIEEYEQRIFSMMKIHNLLFETGNHTTVDVARYLKELITEFKSSHPELAAGITGTIDDTDFSIQSKSGINIGLIVTEVFLNSIKYSQTEGKDFFLNLSFTQNGDSSYLLQISDSGTGFDFEEKIKENTLGLSLIEDLANDLDLTIEVPEPGLSRYSFVIPGDN